MNERPDDGWMAGWSLAKTSVWLNGCIIYGRHQLWRFQSEKLIYCFLGLVSAIIAKFHYLMGLSLLMATIFFPKFLSSCQQMPFSSLIDFFYNKMLIYRQSLAHSNGILVAKINLLRVKGLWPSYGGLQEKIKWKNWRINVKFSFFSWPSV